MPMIRDAPAAFAPSATCHQVSLNNRFLKLLRTKPENIQMFRLRFEKLTASPTVPRPNTATIDPASTFAVFQTAPRPKFNSYCHKTEFGHKKIYKDLLRKK